MGRPGTRFSYVPKTFRLQKMNSISTFVKSCAVKGFCFDNTEGFL